MNSQPTSEILPEPPIFRGGKEGGVVTPATQSIILDALTKGETDPKAIAKMAGLGRAVDVFAAIDRLSLRKEFHAALGRAGLDLDTVAKRLKQVIEDDDPEISIKGISVLLKSVGLEKNEEAVAPPTGWEEEVWKKGEAIDTEETEDGKYEVVEPEMPESLKAEKKKEQEESEKLFK